MTTAAPPPLLPHRLHDAEVERMLATGEHRRELTAYFGEDGYRELSALARSAAAATRRGGPPVYVLPGLMGSRIGLRGRLLDDVIWLDPVEVVAGHLVRLALPRGARLVALGAMLLNTLKLKLSLQIAGFDARFHAYDWRLDVEGLAKALLARIDADGARDVLLVGHSMGGVVARVALAAEPDRIARVVQLGAPNRGSFAPVLALRGVYPTVRKLAALDLRHDAEDLARIIFRTLPSLHELLPAAADGPAGGLFDLAAWPTDGPRPDRERLADAAAARSRWPESDPRCLHIVGVRQETVTRAEVRDGEFHYRVEHDGDGTVPLSLATLPGAAQWYVAEKHGGLPNNGRVIAATVDLLRSGETDRLPASTRRARSPGRRIVTEATLRRIAPHKLRWQDLSPDARRRLLEPVVSPEFHGTVTPRSLRQRDQGSSGKASSVKAVVPGSTHAARRRLEIRLVHGNIADANARALVLGVFPNVDPSGAASAIDARLGGAIREAAQRRMFAGQLGEISALPPTRGALLAESVLFVGLGDFDDFGAEAQSFVAGQIVRSLATSGVEDFATVLFGAGSGVPVAAAVEQQLGGFVAGLRNSDPDAVVRRITLCEIDGRKYASMRRAARRFAAQAGHDDLEIVVDEASVPEDDRSAALARAARAAAQRADPAYLLVTLLDQGRRGHECRSSVLTAGAKAAVLSSTLRIDRKALAAQLARAEGGTLTPASMPRFGTELGRLLLGPGVLDGLASMRGRPLVIVHDREASRIPWEALRAGGAWPALDGGLSRRYASESLSVARWQEHRSLGPQLRVLLAIDPTDDLPGAADEGAALSRLLRASGAEVAVLEGRTATRAALLRELRSGRHDVLHFAGHGFFDARDPGRSGLLCAGREVLSGGDLDGVGNLPALVFFNACEAARVRRRRTGAGTSPSRSLFALRRSTSVAEAFLGGGVANFLGTHWPVGDAAALSFSSRFYASLLDGTALGDCVLEGRRAVHEQDSIDWADYVHYGAHDFSFRDTRPD